MRKKGSVLRYLLLFQGIYYVLAGVWPLLHLPSFLEVTGGKTDLWLVKTVGLLIAVSGLAFMMESRSERPKGSIVFLAIAQAVTLAGVDIFYVVTAIISKVYLADAVLELALAGSFILFTNNSGRNTLSQKVTD